MPVIFRCNRCWEPVTRELRELEVFSLVRGDAGRDEYNPLQAIPAGFFVLALALLAEREVELRTSPLAWHSDGWLFNTGDLILHPGKSNPQDVGCCGFTGLYGLNAYCAKGHAFGTQVTDCCTVHFAWASEQVQLERSERAGS